MKSLIALVFTLILMTSPLNAQYETTMFLYDTISEGPLITPEKGGYNFIFKTRNMGTMVSTRGQVINPAISYDMFNHYHIKSSGEVDSLFAIPVRSQVGHHYTMYKRGAPKLLQFRVGTSNDHSLEKIASKYPILNNYYTNDEPLILEKISISKDNRYKYTKTSFHQGEVKKEGQETIIKKSFTKESWHQKGYLSSFNTDVPISIILFGKSLLENKNNDLHEFSFTTLDVNGSITHQKEIIFERAYKYQNSGIIHNTSGIASGFYFSLVEASGKVNKDYNSAVQKILLFDKEGKYLSETLITLPFTPKSKEVAYQKVVKVIQHKDEFSVILHTPGSKKSKTQKGYYTFVENGETAEEVAFKTTDELNVAQILRNKPGEETKMSVNQEFKYAEKLANGDLLLVASENGKQIDFMQLDPTGNLKYISTSFLLSNVENAKSLLSFEQLENNKVLLISKVAQEKAVKTNYSIYDGRYGRLTTIQPDADLQSIYSYRNANDIMVFGSSVEDVNILLFKLIKINKNAGALTTLSSQ